MSLVFQGRESASSTFLLWRGCRVFPFPLNEDSVISCFGFEMARFLLYACYLFGHVRVRACVYVCNFLLKLLMLSACTRLLNIGSGADMNIDDSDGKNKRTRYDSSNNDTIVDIN